MHPGVSSRIKGDYSEFEEEHKRGPSRKGPPGESDNEMFPRSDRKTGGLDARKQGRPSPRRTGGKGAGLTDNENDFVIGPESQYSMLRARELGGGSETEGAVVEDPVDMQPRDIIIDDLDSNAERVLQKRRTKKKRGQST